VLKVSGIDFLRVLLQIWLESAMASGPGLSLRIGATLGVAVFVFLVIQFTFAGKYFIWPSFTLVSFLCGFPFAYCCVFTGGTSIKQIDIYRKTN
jgi:Na+/H+ antiporter NhaA